MYTKSEFVSRSSLVSGAAVDDGDLLEVAVAPTRDDLGVQSHVDVGGGVNALDEVLRHRLFEGSGPDEQRDAPGEGREVERGLAGRVGRADDVHLFVLTEARLARTGPVVDAAARELFDPGRVESPVRHAGRGEHGASLDLDVAVEMHCMDRPARSRRATSRASTISAPKRRACATARCVRSAPERPFGNPR